MAKYSFEFKKKIVTEYLEGKDSSNGLAKKYGIPQGKMVRNWISNYNEFGDDGLRMFTKKSKIFF